ncbi:hypothetical protein SAMN04244573_02065 [Azotobacter beijerinckii]|uniref:Uncharacterized protein n=1 Tax=Azotobacter beijerinckii TaxID=170623 RepID=A0A1H9I4M5_9GAMM|nr:hypothetical protein [Azotobacter beijerinckii]SEQ69488.1 hypothetical protein SAMN04244573_02065 [Azotobacter beijerinckii]
MKPAPVFRPLRADSQANSLAVLGYRTDASYLELTNEADMRQSAAQHLLNVLSCVTDLDEFTASELAGCFLAVRLLSSDARTLYDAACDCRRREHQASKGIGQASEVHGLHTVKHARAGQ